MWVAPDTPAASVYVPFYPGAGDLHSLAYSTGTLKEFRRDSAYWAFDFVANWASLANWRNASQQVVLPLRSRLHNEIAQEMKAVEDRAKQEGLAVLADWQRRTQQRVVDRWWRLADELIVMYNDGFYNDAKANKLGISLGYPDWWARQVGFNQDVHPIFVRRDYTPDMTFLSDGNMAPPNFAAFANQLPDQYDFASATWTFTSERSTSFRVAERLALVNQVPIGVSMVNALVLFATLLVGFCAGRFVERLKRHRHSEHSRSYERLI